MTRMIWRTVVGVGALLMALHDINAGWFVTAMIVQLWAVGRRSVPSSWRATTAKSRWRSAARAVAVATLTDTGAVLTIRLPHRLETPNAWLWSHWRTKKRAKDAWSERLRIACLSPAAVAMSIGGNVELASWIGWTAPTNRPIVRITRQVPSRRNFITDRENRLFAAKALVDCLVQAGFLANDREQDIDLQVPQVVSADGLDWTEIVIDARAPEHRTTEVA